MPILIQLLSSLSLSVLGMLEPGEIPANLSKSAPSVIWEKSTKVVGDFDCDGKPDQAFLGRAKGRIFIGVVRASSSIPEVLDFAIDSRIQAAICSEPAILAIESLDYNPVEIVGNPPGFRQSRSGHGLKLSGGDCDSVHIYWNHNNSHLSWWRA